MANALGTYPLLVGAAAAIFMGLAGVAFVWLRAGRRP